MSRPSQNRQSVFIAICACLLVVMLSLSAFGQAQDATATSQGAPIEISGPVSAVGTGTITVSGLTVDVSGLALNVTLTPGTVITVSGFMSPTNVIVAQTVVINIVSATVTPASAVTVTATTPAGTPSVTPAVTQAATATGTISTTVTATVPAGTPSVTPAVTATATPSSNVIIVIEGPVINIVNNFITIYDFDIEVEANHPILNLIQIGDLIRIEGAFGSGGVVVATVVSNVSSTLVSGATVSLDGPVESINGNIIVINGIAVQLAANDPLLQTVQVGQFVSVQGNFQNNGTTIVLVVVTIVVNTNNGGNNGGNNNGGGNCYWKESGMSGMGKWKCSNKKS